MTATSDLLSFRIEAECPGSRARAARFRTLHNEVLTPLFMPVATQAAIKGMSMHAVESAGSQILLANTYHLHLRPGPEVFQKAGGIHGFMNWGKSVLTDSGGFQIFSLPHARQISDAGAAFTSPIDGKRVLLTPELSIETQRAIGSDIMMALDQCIPSTAGRAEAEAALEITHAWARRSLAAREGSSQALFGIVQGACFEDLRQRSAEFLTRLPFDGFAIGGLAVGETKSQREDFTELTAGLLPRELPRYLMGVGTPIDLLEGVYRGVDMFDCILPSAWAQQGIAFTMDGVIKLRRSVYRFSEDALDPSCACEGCTRHSRAYLHHLVKAREVLGWHLLANHNIHFYHRLMREIRESILNGRFEALYRDRRESLARSDEENPPVAPKRKRRRRAPTRLGDYELRAGEDGRARIAQLSSGEAMHPSLDPDREARELYIEQARLAERAAEGAAGPLVVWDVGLGAAHNAMAAIREWERLATHERALELVSFENDLDSLRLAFGNDAIFPHLRHGAPAAILESGSWSSKNGRIRWQLLEGDFLERLGDAPAPEVIFYDPFSAKADARLWSAGAFARVREACGERPVELFTYSASTSVRAALLAAGFFVADGAPTAGGGGQARATTVATTQRPGHGARRLGPEWLERWRRSGARFPADVAPEHHARFEATILGHEQFRG